MIIEKGAVEVISTFEFDEFVVLVVPVQLDDQHLPCDLLIVKPDWFSTPVSLEAHEAA